jgi:hypothetical protein
MDVSFTVLGRKINNSGKSLVRVTHGKIPRFKSEGRWQDVTKMCIKGVSYEVSGN